MKHPSFSISQMHIIAIKFLFTCPGASCTRPFPLNYIAGRHYARGVFHFYQSASSLITYCFITELRINFLL